MSVLAVWKEFPMVPFGRKSKTKYPKNGAAKKLNTSRDKARFAKKIKSYGTSMSRM